MTADFRRRAAALLEVLGVYLAGPVLMLGLRRLLGVTIANPLSTLTANASNSYLVTAAGQLFLLVLVSNAGCYVLAGPLNWWHRRRRPADYGFTKAGHTWKFLVLAGIATAAFFEWPVVSLTLENFIHPNATVAWRQALFDMSWQRWQFWLFSGALSWAGAPFFEEIFYRGYCQRRLAEDWGNGPAILGAACLFTFSHAQYLHLDPYNAGMTAGLLLSAIGFGLVFAATKSLIPSMLAHSLFDILMTKTFEALFLAALVIIAIAVRRKMVSAIRQVFSSASITACIALGVVAGGYAALTDQDSIIVYVVVAAFAALVCAIVFEAQDRPGIYAGKASATANALSGAASGATDS